MNKSQTCNYIKIMKYFIGKSFFLLKYIMTDSRSKRLGIQGKISKGKNKLINFNIAD